MKLFSLIIFLAFCAVLFGMNLTKFLSPNIPNDVALNRSLIKLADDACKNNRGAKSYTKNMTFVCNDGTTVIAP